MSKFYNNPILRAMFWTTVLFSVYTIVLFFLAKNDDAEVFSLFSLIHILAIWIHIVVLGIMGVTDLLRGVGHKSNVNITRYFITLLWLIVLIFMVMTPDDIVLGTIYMLDILPGFLIR